MKTLTISIAAYNAENYIGKALGLLTESGCLHDLQVIVVDDGSTDLTANIARRYSDENPDSIQLISKENGGYGSTINCSIKHADGKYYRLLDADDWLDSESLRDVVMYLKNCETDIVLCDYSRVYEQSGNRETEAFSEIPHYEIKPIEDLRLFNLNPAMIVKTSILKDGCYSITEKCFYTDIEYCALAITRSVNFVYLPISLYNYRIGRGDQSISVNQKIRHIDDHDLMVRKTSEMLLSNNKFTGYKEAVCKMLMGHIVSFSIYVKPTIVNYKKFRSYCDFVKTIAPETVNLLNPVYKRIFNYPVFYLPFLVKNRVCSLLYKFKCMVFK